MCLTETTEVFSNVRNFRKDAKKRYQRNFEIHHVFLLHIEEKKVKMECFGALKDLFKLKQLKPLSHQEQGTAIKHGNQLICKFLRLANSVLFHGVRVAPWSKAG